jgi:hypothetical protein
MILRYLCPHSASMIWDYRLNTARHLLNLPNIFCLHGFKESCPHLIVWVERFAIAIHFVEGVIAAYAA